MKPKRRFRWGLVLGLVIGAIAGWTYWRFVGCVSGSCPIWSNVYIATGYGALLGLLMVWSVPKRKKKETTDDRQAGEAVETNPKEV